MANKRYDDDDPFFSWQFVLILLGALMLSVPMGVALIRMDIENTLFWVYRTLVG